MDCSLPGSSVRGDSPGKNAGVGCCFLLKGLFLTQGLNHISYVSCIGRQVLYQLLPPGRPSGVGSHSLLQGIFPTQGSHLSLMHCRHILYHLSHHQRSVLVSRKKRDMPTLGHYFYFLFEFFSIMAYYTVLTIVCLFYL